jgi:hypothetical protein
MIYIKDASVCTPCEILRNRDILEGPFVNLKGKDADLVIMDKGLNAVATIVGGKIVHREKNTAV